MRIGLFTDAYLPDINGVVSSVATLKHALEELGHTVFVITNHKGVKIAEDEDGHILRLPGLEIKKFYGYKMSSPVQFTADAYIEKMDLDVIHIQTEAGVGRYYIFQLCIRIIQCMRIIRIILIRLNLIL